MAPMKKPGAETSRKHEQFGPNLYVPRRRSENALRSATCQAARELARYRERERGLGRRNTFVKAVARRTLQAHSPCVERRRRKSISPRSSRLRPGAIQGNGIAAH